MAARRPCRRRKCAGANDGSIAFLGERQLTLEHAEPFREGVPVGGGPPRLREDFDHVKRARGTSAIEHQCLSHADFDLAVIGLFFDARVRDELAHRLPHVNAEQVAHDAELLVAVRWLCDLDVGAAEGDEPSFQATCVAGLRAHLDSLY